MKIEHLYLSISSSPLPLYHLDTVSIPSYNNKKSEGILTHAYTPASVR